MDSGVAPIRVLHIEDEPDIRAHIQDVLEARGFHATQAGSLAAGIFAATSERIDVAILDLNLHDSNGLETLVTFKQCFPRTPVVILAGDQPHAGNRAIQDGADDFVAKSDLDPDHLVDIVRYTHERNVRRRLDEKAVARETRHNLATPLTPIKLQLDVIRRSLTEHPDTLSYLDSIERNVHRLENELHRFDETVDDATKDHPSFSRSEPDATSTEEDLTD